MELIMKGDFKMKEQIRKSLEDVIKEEITKIANMSFEININFSSILNSPLIFIFVKRKKPC